MFVTTQRFDDRLDAWSKAQDATLSARLDAHGQQLTEVRAKAEAAAQASARTHRQVDSLVCSLVQRGKPVGDLCVLPAGGRRALEGGQ